MSGALWIAKTGLEAQQMRLAVISNNLSNVNTTGYKYSRPVFEDLLYQSARQVHNETNELPSGFTMGTGVRTVATEIIHTQGNLTETSNPFDIAINGEGFFQILRPDGAIGYTRDGSFQVNAHGKLVTSSGLLLHPVVKIPENSSSVKIATDGVVTATIPGSPKPVKIGHIQTAGFLNPTGLQSVDEKYYVESEASGTPHVGTPGVNGLGAVIQGKLESSNVNVIKEMIDMIEAQRAYEVNSKAVYTADQMWQYLNSNL